PDFIRGRSRLRGAEVIQYYSRTEYSLTQPDEVIFRQPIWRNQMYELKRRNQPDPKAHIARAGSQIVVTAREQRLSVAIKLKRSLPRLVQVQIMQCNAPPYTKARSATH